MRLAIVGWSLVPGPLIPVDYQIVATEVQTQLGEIGAVSPFAASRIALGPQPLVLFTSKCSTIRCGKDNSV